MAEDSGSNAISLNVCTTCNAPSKYCCPGCSAYSCSLDCVKAHKLKTECDGIRDKTAFVPVERFKDSDYLSDYQFLEGINRSIANAARSKRKQGYSHFLPQNLYRLKMAAKVRETDLQILPIVFSKRKINTSYLRYQDRKIFWRIEWSFPQIDKTFSDERIDEDILLGACLDKYLLPIEENSDESLQYYQSVGHMGIVVLLKNEDALANDARYFQLNQTKSLKKNFSGKRIIEYPTLIIVPKIHMECYPLVGFDEFEKEEPCVIEL